MTPIAFAEGLATSDNPRSQALGVAIIARGLSDDDPATLRQGWPLQVAVPAAIEYLGLPSTESLIAEATALAPTVSDAMLNKRAG